MYKANIYAYFSDMSLFTLRGVSNKHCLLPLFSLYPPQTVFVGGYTVFTLSDRPTDRPCVRNVLFP